ncbi:hypothetical protein [Acinetobacter baumannii]|uniref:hypothetical protein n=1 Tax=Acinetobacter baumannii TaxID=470 RepID=UPI00224876FB|nr:hypothetical protein [Acinetobacter baumannii]
MPAADVQNVTRFGCRGRGRSSCDEDDVEDVRGRSSGRGGGRSRRDDDDDDDDRRGRSDGRGQNSRNQKRDAYGRFTS